MAAQAHEEPVKENAPQASSAISPLEDQASELESASFAYPVTGVRKESTMESPPAPPPLGNAPSSAFPVTEVPGGEQQDSASREIEVAATQPQGSAFPTLEVPEAVSQSSGPSVEELTEKQDAAHPTIEVPPADPVVEEAEEDLEQEFEEEDVEELQEQIQDLLAALGEEGRKVEVLSRALQKN
eukprot:gene12667-14976_t